MQDLAVTRAAAKIYQPGYAEVFLGLDKYLTVVDGGAPVAAPATVNAKVPAGFEEAWQRHHAR